MGNKLIKVYKTKFYYICKKLSISNILPINSKWLIGIETKTKTWQWSWFATAALCAGLLSSLSVSCSTCRASSYSRRASATSTSTRQPSTSCFCSAASCAASVWCCWFWEASCASSGGVMIHETARTNCPLCRSYPARSRARAQTWSW